MRTNNAGLLLERLPVRDITVVERDVLKSYFQGDEGNRLETGFILSLYIDFWFY